MRPFSIYHIHKNLFTPIQEQLAAIIIKAAKPDAVFLLGATLQRRRSESIFNDSAPTSHYISDCFMLVVIAGMVHKEQNVWQDKIETLCSTIMPVTTIVLNTANFLEWCAAGHRLAVMVLQSAVMLYSRTEIEWKIVNAATHIINIKEEKKLFTHDITKAMEFFAGAELYQVRRQYGIAAFMLHQAAEQSLRALLKAGTGYHTVTHNIDRLLRYASLISYQLPDVVNSNIAQDKKLLGLLQKAYIDSRYGTGYFVNSDDLLSLTNKVRTIIEIVRETGNYVLDKLTTQSPEL